MRAGNAPPELHRLWFDRQGLSTLYRLHLGKLLRRLTSVSTAKRCGKRVDHWQLLSAERRRRVSGATSRMTWSVRRDLPARTISTSSHLAPDPRLRCGSRTASITGNLDQAPMSLKSASPDLLRARVFNSIDAGTTISSSSHASFPAPDIYLDNEAVRRLRRSLAASVYQGRRLLPSSDTACRHVVFMKLAQIKLTWLVAASASNCF